MNPLENENSLQPSGANPSCPFPVAFNIRRSASAVKLTSKEMLKYTKEHWG